MPKTIPAAGEAMPVTLEELIARHNAALAVANAFEGTFQGTAEEAELLAACDAFADTKARLKSYTGVLDALRLAAKENEDFESSSVSVAAVKGALDFLEEREAEMPVTRADRLSRELSETMAQYFDGTFMALVYPAGNPHGHWFRNISTIDVRARLREITSEAARLIAANPDLDIDHVTVNKDGVYTALAIPGVDPVEPDPIIAAIQAFDDGNKAFEAIKEKDWDKHGGQEAVIEKTYGPPMRIVGDWDQPCKSTEGAIAALRHAAQEAENFSCSDSLTAMVGAALAYLEGKRS